MSRWNRPMRRYVPSPAEKPPRTPSVHPTVKRKVLACFPEDGTPLTYLQIADASGYQSQTVFRAINALEIAGEITGIYNPLPFRWARRTNGG